MSANLIGLGHTVRHAVRSDSAAHIPAGSAAIPVEGAARDADLVVLAVPFDAAGLEPGTILVDATSPFGQTPAGRKRQRRKCRGAGCPDGVRVVKAFDVLGAEHMADPLLPDGHRPLLPVTTDDPDARDLVGAPARDMGFDAMPVGDLSDAGLLEDAARYWGLVAFAGGRSQPRGRAGRPPEAVGLRPVRLLRPARMRDHDVAERPSTPLQLLFDLCFVVALAALVAELHHGIVAGMRAQRA